MLLKKSLLFSVIFFCLCFISSCRQQANKVDSEKLPQRIEVSVKDSVLLSLDKSPMDMIYFPEDYPKQKMMNPKLANPVARAIYSRPQKREELFLQIRYPLKMQFSDMAKRGGLAPMKPQRSNFLSRLSSTEKN